MPGDEPVDLRLVPAALAVWAAAVVGVCAGEQATRLAGACAGVAAAGVGALAHAALGARRRPPRHRPPRATGPAWSAGTAWLVGTARSAGQAWSAGTARQAGTAGPAVHAGGVRARHVRYPTRGGQAALVIGAVAVLLLVLSVQLGARDAGGLRDLAADGERVRLVGVVRSTPQPLRTGSRASAGAGTRAGPDEGSSAGTVRFVLAARSVGQLSADPARTSPTGAAVEVLATGSAASLAYGTLVEVEARLSPARDPAGRVVVRARAASDVVVRAPPGGALRWADRLRVGLVGTARGVPGDAGALLPAIAVGDTRGVGDLDEAMRASGLAHLTAVSGAHFALVGGVVLALAARCRVPRRARWIPAGLVMAGFVALVQPGASVVRAAVMGAVGVLGLVAGRPARSVPALATAVLVLLVVDPWLAREIGFVLSVVTTAGIALLAGPMARRWDRPRRRGRRSDGSPGGARAGPSPLATALAAPVAAQAVCAPVVLLLSPDVPTYAVVANVAAAPAVAPATVGGLVAALVGPWWPDAATACAQLAGAACWWIAAVARTVAGLPGARVAWAGGAFGMVLLAAACAAVVVLVLRCGRDVAP